MTRLALLFSDGTLSVLREGISLTRAHDERDYTDIGEIDPDRRTKLVRVFIEVEATIEDPTNDSAGAYP